MKEKAAVDVTQDDAELWCQQVHLGRWDEYLHLVVKAIGERAVVAEGGVKWRLNWAEQDLVITQDNLTLFECERAETLAGKSWARLHVSGEFSSAKDNRAVLQAALEERKSLSTADARELLRPLTVAAVGDMLEEYVAEGPPPFGSPESPTT